MAENLTRREEQRGTRKIMMWGVVVAAALFIIGMALVFLWPYLFRVS